MIQEMSLLLKKRNKKNVSVINNIFVKREMKRWKSNIDKDNDSWEVICHIRFTGEGKPIWMINNIHQWNTFTTIWAGNGPYYFPRQFLDEDNIKIMIDFEDCFNDEIVFSDVLWKNLQVLQNHIALSFTAEWIEFFLVFQSLVYSLECYPLLNQCFQNGQLVELAWCLPLQLRHLKECRQGSPFLVSNLGGLILSLALQHQVKWWWWMVWWDLLHLMYLALWI